jgi:vWA-MoxR associated protein C-terminal domain/vWA-MoxR associated protein middle region (VMAP-M) 1/Effector-associated domain 9
MIRCQQIKLKALKDRFEKLEKDYQDVSKQRDSTTNAQEINNFERQLATILETLSKTESEIDELEKKIQEFKEKELNTNIPEALQTLVNLLTVIDFEVVARIYRSCLSQGRLRLVPNRLEALVQQLTDIPGVPNEPNEPEPLVRFVGLLIQEAAITTEQQESLKTWATQQGMMLQSEKPASSETAEICLMVKVQPCALNDPSLGYVVSAAIAQDPNPWNPDIKPITTPITITVRPDPKCAPGYAQDDLPLILNELIGTCGKEHHIPLTDLIIQWFLPIQLMSLPVEHWQIQIGESQKQCSGGRCKAVIVRSSDRHFLPHYQLASGDWQKYWKRLLECQEARCAETLAPLDPIARKTTINWKKPKVVGCKFVEHHELQQQKVLWEQLLGQGVPIALWMRQSREDTQITKRVMQTVTKCSIVKLPESLADHRQKALSSDSETDRLKAASLCLLLDNPFRPFPTLDYESA